MIIIKGGPEPLEKFKSFDQNEKKNKKRTCHTKFKSFDPNEKKNKKRTCHTKFKLYD